MQETHFGFLVQEDPLEEEMAVHSSILAWEIPGTEEPDRLQTTGSQRVAHDNCAQHSSTYICAIESLCRTAETATIL